MAQQELATAPADYTNEQVRLDSFENVKFWRKYARFAQLGFRYVAEKNIMICHNCQQITWNFLSENDLELFHIKTTPCCLVIRKSMGDEYVLNTFVNSSSEFEGELFICKICHNRKVSHYFWPCMHAPACDICTEQTEICYYCQSPVLKKKKLYY